MKKILLTILGLLSFVCIQAQEATLSFDNSANRTVRTDNQQVWEQNGITLTNNKAASTNNVADYAKPARFYKSSEIIIECSLGNITGIVFDCNSESYATALNNSITGASVSSDKVTVTLDGSSNRFTIATLSAQVRLDAITVTYGSSDPNAVFPPSITPNGGEYVEGDKAEVTITGAAGQDLFYALNSDDLNQAEEYTGETLEITSTTTVYAWASNGTNTSEAASATFNFTAPLGNIAAFNALDKGKAAKFISPLTAVYQNGNNLIVKDDSGVMLIYGNVGQTYNNGDVIAAGVRGTVSEYGGNKQLSPLAESFAAGVAGTAVAPVKKTVAELASCAFLDYVKLEGVYFTLDEGKTKNYTVSDGTDSFAAYNQFGITIEGLAEGVTYNVEGFISSYNENAQLQPISITVADASGITGESSVYETFDSVLPGDWTATVVSGDKEWNWKSYSSNGYASMSAYGATVVPVEAWYVSPALNVKDAEKKTASFKTQVNAYGSTTTEFKVYVLDNVDPSKATLKTELAATLATAPESGFSAWAESGDIDLSTYGDVVYIAFHYVAPEAASATWCVDDFAFNYVPEELGTKEAPITVAEAMVVYVDGEQKAAWVTGYIVGCLNGSIDKPVFTTEGAVATNMLIADEATCTDVTKCIPVALPSGNVRTGLNLKDNPINLGRKVTINGDIMKYFNVAGLKNSTEYVLEGSSAIEEVGVDTNALVEYYNLQGVKVVNPENGIFIKKQGTKTTKVIL